MIGAAYMMWPSRLQQPGHHFTPPDSKVFGANVGPIWGRQDPGGPQVGPMNFAIWDITGQASTGPLSTHSAPLLNALH